MRNEHLIEIVTRAVAGDEAAFGLLCEKKAKDILFLCIKLTGNPEYGRDAAQDVLLYMQTGICKLRDPASFPVWLNRVVSNSCIKTVQRERREAGAFRVEEYSEALVDNSYEFLPPEWAESRERRAAVLAALDGLSLRHRQLLLLFYFERLSTKEIALALKMSPDAVKMGLSRARKALKRRVEKEVGVSLPTALTAAVPTLSLVLEREVEGVATREGVKAILAACGVGLPAAGAAGGAAAGALQFAAFALAITVCTAAVVGGASIGSSPAPAPAAGQSGIPQYHSSSVPPGEGTGGPYSSGPLGEIESSSHLNEVPGTEEEHPLAPSVPGQAESTQLHTFHGQVVYLASDGTPIGHTGLDMSGITVSLYNGGILLATALTAADGRYSLRLPDIEWRGLRLVASLPSEDFSFCAPSEAGVVQLAAEGVLPALYLTDTRAPRGSVLLLDARGDATHNPVGPATAVLKVWDASPTATHWQLHEQGTGTLLMEGQGNTVQLDVYSPAGLVRCTLTFTVEDLAGNTTQVGKQVILLPA